MSIKGVAKRMAGDAFDEYVNRDDGYDEKAQHDHTWLKNGAMKKRIVEGGRKLPWKKDFDDIIAGLLSKEKEERDENF